MDFGVFSLLPPVLAIFLAFLTKNVLLSLFCAVFVGATMLSGNPLIGFVDVFGNYMIPQIADSFNAGVIAMTLFVGCFSMMLEKGGGAYAFGKSVENKITTAKQGQVAGWIGGLMIWFSDSSNSVIIGPILRGVTDRLRISREKLAYICDSTASSVPLLIPVTGWAAVVMGNFRGQFPEDSNLVEIFTRSVPFNLYTITIIVMVLVVAVTGWDFGPMRKAENRARENGNVRGDAVRQNEAVEFVLPEGAKPTPWGMFLPLAVLISSLFACLIYTGRGEDTSGVIDAIVNGETMLSLAVAFFLASFTGGIMAIKHKVLDFKGVYDAWTGGFQRMIEAILILVFSWCIGSVTSHVGAADFIVEATKSFMTPGIMFISIFVIACFTSFATGTSWGTFAIFLPIAIPLALANDVSVYPAIGASLAGGLFGDHCSPISDSTILASLGADCDHLSHVKTQLPYALLAAAASVIGYIVAAITMSAAAALVVTLVAMTVFLYAAKSLDRSGQNAEKGGKQAV